MQTTLVNSTKIAVKNNLGMEEAISVRELTIRQLYVFIEDITTGQTPALVAFCTDRPIEWVDSLDIDSYGALAQLCIKLNFTNAMKIAEKDISVATKMAPLIAALGNALALTTKSAALFETGGAAGATTSPTPSPSASAAAAGRLDHVPRHHGRNPPAL